MSAWKEATVLDDTISDLAKTHLNIKAGDAYKNTTAILRRYDKEYMLVPLDSNSQAEVDVTPKSTYELVSDDTGSATSGQFKVGVGENIDVLLDYVPDGKTALPVGDVILLQRCASCYSTFAFTTLDDILGDTTCVAAICASNNAIDYIIRSFNAFSAKMFANSYFRAGIKANTYANYAMAIDITWASYINNLAYDVRRSVWNAIPAFAVYPSGTINSCTMSDGGTAHSSSAFINNNVSLVFDGSFVYSVIHSTQLDASNPSASNYIEYDYPYSVCLKRLLFDTGYGVSRSPVVSLYYYLEGSNDGLTWVSLKIRNMSMAIEDSCGGLNKGNVNNIFDLSDNVLSFSKYRIRMSSGNYYNSDYWWQTAGELQFEGAKVV